MKKILITIAIIIASIATAKADNRKPITTDQLPSAATEFINKHFGQAKILYCVEESEMFEMTEYEVMFDDRSKIEFDSKGQWKQVSSSSIDSSLIPEKIRSFINTNFPGEKAIKISREKHEWELTLSNRIELEFDRQFNLIGYDD